MTVFQLLVPPNEVKENLLFQFIDYRLEENTPRLYYTEGIEHQLQIVCQYDKFLYNELPIQLYTT